MAGNRFGGSSSEYFVDQNGRPVRPGPTLTFWSGDSDDLSRTQYADLRSLDDPATPVNSITGLADGTLPEFVQPDESVTRMWASSDGGVTGTWITTSTLSKAAATGDYADLAGKPTIPSSAADIGAATVEDVAGVVASLEDKVDLADLDVQNAAVVADTASETRGALNAAIGKQSARHAVASVDAFGGDPTGAADSAAAFNAALASLPVNPDGLPVGVIEFSAGTYLLGTADETNNFGPKVLVKGKGWGATILDYRGAGRCLREYSNLFYNSSYAVMFENKDMGGGVVDLTIDGTNAGAGAVGLKFGDVLGAKVRVEVRHFNKAGDIGVRQVNTVTWTEKIECYSYVWDCTTHYQIDADFGDETSTIAQAVTLPAASITLATFPECLPRPVGDTAAPAPNIYVNAAQKITYQGFTDNGDGTVTLTGCAGGSGALAVGDTVQFGSAGVSHGYNNIYLNLGAGPGGQIGLVVKDGANLYSGEVHVRGNFPNTASGVANDAVSVILSGNVKPGLRLTTGAAQISWAHLDIQLEAYGGVTAPTTMRIDAGSVIRNCYGIMRWGGGWTPMGLAISDGARVNFFGYIVGDTSLNSDTSINTGGPKFRAPLLYHAAQGNSNGPIAKFNDGDFVDLVLNSGSSGTLALHSAGLATINGPQRKILIVHQPSSGGTYNYPLTWPTSTTPSVTTPTVKWAGGTAPVMSTGQGATDVYELVTMDGATWYAQRLGGAYA